MTKIPNPNVNIELPIHGDGDQLRPILETWIRDSETHKPIKDEIEGVVAAIESAASGEGEKVFFVAKDIGGKILGMVGYTIPDESFRSFANTPNPAELINAYVSTDVRGQGVGSALVDALEIHAAHSGFTEVILNSGPRYKDSGHGFYDKRYGDPVAIVQDAYGPGIDAPIWTHTLEEDR